MSTEHLPAIHVGAGPDFKRVADPSINNANAKLAASTLNWRTHHLNSTYSFFNVDHFSFEGADFIPTNQQIETAPESVRTILKLCGITSADNITVQLVRDRMSGNFEISFLPQEVTDDCLGAIISSDPNHGGVIAPAYTGPLVGDEQISYARRFGQDDGTGYPTVEHKPERTIRTFQRMNRVSEGKFDGRRFDDGGFIQRTPEMAELLLDSTDWILELNRNTQLQPV